MKQPQASQETFLVAGFKSASEATPMRLILSALTIALTTIACRVPTTSATGITILLEASPKAAQTGDTVTFVVNVTANNVSTVAIDYGDSSGDLYAAGGFATARAVFKHAYATVGNYIARATVSDEVVGSRVVTQMIVVADPPDGAQSR